MGKKISELTESTTFNNEFKSPVINNNSTKKYLKENLLNIMWPINSIIIMATTEDPGDALGFGTWERLATNRYLNAYPSNETGGATTEINSTIDDNYAITKAQMPNHNHTWWQMRGMTSGGWSSGHSNDANGGWSMGAVGGDQPHSHNVNGEMDHTHTFTIPYVIVYAWKRIE